MFKSLISTVLLSFILSSCASYEKFRQITEEYEFPSQVFDADYNKTWQAVIQVMRKFDLVVQNQETGTIKTRWMDNTREFNFQTSFSRNDSVKAAQFKLQVNVVKGFRGGREVTKVTFYKRQLIEQDFLQGWREKTSEGIQERTLLYRIERLLMIEKKLDEIQKKREEKQLESF